MELLVTADDRTGAYETAAVLADRRGVAVEARAWPDIDDLPDVAVVDLGSRHLAAIDAAHRVRTTGGQAKLRAHKIDSRLRGNWVAEVGALAIDAPVLMIPALPSMGRTCVGGVVYEHGAPIDSSDVRRGAAEGRPARTLSSGTNTDLPVNEAHDREVAHSWLANPVGVCVADAATDADIADLVAAWRRTPSRVALVGTSAVAGAATAPSAAPMPRCTVDGNVLVVCGSAHSAARRQLAALEASSFGPAVSIIASTEPIGPVTDRAAEIMAADLAQQARTWLSKQAIALIIVLGGDTTAAFVGDERVNVHGAAGPGTAIVRLASIDVPLITRSGGFGEHDSLVDLVRATLRP